MQLIRNWCRTRFGFHALFNCLQWSLIEILLRVENNEEIKPIKIGVPVRVNLIEHELHLISKVQSLLADCGDFRSCSRADALRLALDLLDLSCPNGILDSFNNIKKYDRRTGSKKCIDK